MSHKLCILRVSNIIVSIKNEYYLRVHQYEIFEKFTMKMDGSSTVQRQKAGSRSVRRNELRIHYEQHVLMHISNGINNAYSLHAIVKKLDAQTAISQPNDHSSKMMSFACSNMFRCYSTS